MVKGVNKTIIEVNDTGSKFFEKIVFYVSPQYGNLSAKALRQAAGEIPLGFNLSKKNKTLRHKRIVRRRIFIACGAAVLVLAIAGLVWLIL